MAAVDQLARRRAVAARRRGVSPAARVGETVRRIDLRHTKTVAEIIERYGWPTYSLVGKRGGDAFWLLVQHADARPALQRRCLALMAEAVAAGQASPRLFAYLTDRVRLASGKRQLYGTQFTRIGSRAFGPRPLDAPATVDRRRAACGIEPLGEYAEVMGKFFPADLTLRLPLSYRRRAPRR